MPATDQPPIVLNQSAAKTAQSIGVSLRTLGAMTRAGKIPHVRIGTRVLYPVDELRAWLASQVQPVVDQPNQ